ncbi:MAG: hypothetical protein QG579_376 [Patescibacteria group bacterium]|jgi:hypothetical protein|nr:hypothetical protein [Patescibacteria group bacterium]
MSEGIPISNPEKEVTQEDWENLKSLYHSLIIKLDSFPRGYNNFSHVAFNLAQGVGPLEWYQENKMSDKYEGALCHAKNLGEYLQLLEDFPEFKEKEMASVEGMFPDILSEGEGGSIRFVIAVSERLRKK